MKTLLTLLILCASFATANAQRLLGGEIYYQHVDSNKYTVNVKLFRDCYDSAFVSTIDVSVSTSGFAQDSITLTRIGIRDNSNFCKDSVSPCAPSNTPAGQRGVEIHHYQTTIDFNNLPYKTWISNGACKVYLEYKGNFRKSSRRIQEINPNGRLRKYPRCCQFDFILTEQRVFIYYR